MGFRDSCQDLLGFVHLIPEKAKQRIIDIASIQKKDGSTYHQYQPLTKRGNSDIGSGFNDDPLWLIAATSAYLKETGDYSFLSAPVPFDNVVGSEAPLLAHLKASIDFTFAHRGPHVLEEIVGDIVDQGFKGDFVLFDFLGHGMDKIGNAAFFDLGFIPSGGDGLHHLGFD